MAEGSLEAPTRHEIPWQHEDFKDPERIDDELRRVFDVCHGCRRCFNLCDSFPRLFDLIDDSDSGELDSVDSKDFKPVIDACTLCDMCFMTKCPYVPPHEFDLDFPHLMLRYRAMEFSQGKTSFTHRQITETDRNGKLAAPVSKSVNWGLKRKNWLTRPLMEKVFNIDKEASLPEFKNKTFVEKMAVPTIDDIGRKVVLYATCFVNYNNPKIGDAVQAVLAKNGVKTEVVYPSCCGMPQLEQGNIARVAENAEKISSELMEWVDKGYDVLALVPSCALMLKFEWPLILPNNKNVAALSAATYDVAEYIVDIAKKDGLAEGLNELDGPVNLHLACHARAQNMGPKAAEMLRLIPNLQLNILERCSGHGGSWGIMKNNFETAMKIGKPIAKKVAESSGKFVVSECPLAREHIMQGVERLDDTGKPETIAIVQHPIQILAKAYGIET